MRADYSRRSRNESHFLLLRLDAWNRQRMPRRFRKETVSICQMFKPSSSLHSVVFVVSLCRGGNFDDRAAGRLQGKSECEAGEMSRIRKSNIGWSECLRQPKALCCGPEGDGMLREGRSAHKQAIRMGGGCLVKMSATFALLVALLGPDTGLWLADGWLAAPFHPLPWNTRHCTYVHPPPRRPHSAHIKTCTRRALTQGHATLYHLSWWA